MQQASPIWGLAGLAIILVLALSTLLLWQQLSQQAAPAGPVQMRTVALAGTGTTPDATGIIVISLDGDHGALVVDQLPELDADRQYQLWLIEDERRVSGAVFSVDEHGYGTVWISADEPLSAFSAFGISIEPAGGSEGPTGKKVLGGTRK
jgi:anti-sigma-K factor RskA